MKRLAGGSKASNTWRNIPDKDRVILWGRAAARCSFPGCRIVLVAQASSEDDEATFGQAAHIVAHSAAGPRADVSFPADELDRYGNLLLLCGNHHTIVDRQPNTYKVEDLRSWKAEHEAWILARTEPSQYQPVNWKLVIQEDTAQIDTSEIRNAVAPDSSSGEPTHLTVSQKPNGWAWAEKEQRQRIEALIQSVPPSERRFAVFSLTRIPLAIHLGFVFSDRCRVALFQFHRDRGTWTWPKTQGWTPDFLVIDQKELKVGLKGPVVLRISLSATIEEKYVLNTVPNAIGESHLSVRAPSVTWLQESTQIERLGQLYRDQLDKVREQFADRCESIHVLYAGPTAGAISLGRAINPRMNPIVHLYEYQNGAYEPAFTLGGG